ncbi:co-regulatory protein PtrA N-terminal domain-containing protein [Pseudomonas sp. YQ_5]|uniref:co-regulatory protein PtrA N-terminal domain-containing protein n=1 Tax=Pseudomonas sp. YQ_5 TaxID=3367229 RepID=UPI00370A4DFC
MKSFKAMLVVALLGVTAVAMAENGGDRVVAQMDATRHTAMQHYAQVEQMHAHAQSVASNQNQTTHRIEHTR